MDRHLYRYVCTLWIISALFCIARYVCASIMVAGALGDRGTYRMALEAIGPFFPIMSLVCLAGSLLMLVVDWVNTIRNKKK